MLVVICGFIFVGGVQRLASVTEKLVPIMAVIFLVGGLGVLAALLILGAFMLLADRAQPQTLSGTWYSQEGDFTLRAEEGQLCSNDFCFPFERVLPLVDAPTRDNPQGFVLEAGSMGALPGRYFFEGELLYLAGDSQQKIFSRTPPADMAA